MEDGCCPAVVGAPIYPFIKGCVRGKVGIGKPYTNISVNEQAVVTNACCRFYRGQVPVPEMIVFW